MLLQIAETTCDKQSLIWIEGVDEKIGKTTLFEVENRDKSTIIYCELVANG